MSISKILIDLCSIRQKIKIKKHFCRHSFQCFSSEKVLIEQKKVCLKINGKQSVKLIRGAIKFKNYFRHSTVPLTIHADFESGLKNCKEMIEVIMLHILKNITNIIFTVLLTKLHVLIINLVNQLLFTEEKMQSINLLKKFLKKMIIAKM